MLEPRSEPRLVEQKGAELRIADVLPVKALDRDDPGESAVPAEPAEMDDRHPSGRKLAMELIAAEGDRSQIRHPHR